VLECSPVWYQIGVLKLLYVSYTAIPDSVTRTSGLFGPASARPEWAEPLWAQFLGWDVVVTCLARALQCRLQPICPFFAEVPWLLFRFWPLGGDVAVWATIAPPSANADKLSIRW
jgi:hypothetical protein